MTQEISEQARRAFAGSCDPGDLAEALAAIDAPRWASRVHSWTHYVAQGYREAWGELPADVRLAVYVHAASARDGMSPATDPVY